MLVLFMSPLPLKNGAGVILYSDLSVRESVSAWVCASWTPYLKLMKGICPIGFLDMLIRFWVKRSKIKVTAGNDPKTLWIPCLTNQWREFHPILVKAVYGFLDMLIRFWVKRSKVKVTANNEHNVPDEYNIFVNIWANFAEIRPLCTWAWNILIRSIGQRLRSQQADRAYPSMEAHRVPSSSIMLWLHVK